MDASEAPALPYSHGQLNVQVHTGQLPPRKTPELAEYLLHSRQRRKYPHKVGRRDWNMLLP